MQKGIIFLGCSHTWGEGLYFYSGLDGLPFTETHSYDASKIRSVFHDYRKKYRYTRLLSDNLDTWEYTSDIGNGGTNITHFNYVIQENMKHGHIKYNDFGLFVWQLTDPVRDIPGGHDRLEKETNDDFYQSEIKNHLFFIERIVRRWESKGVKVLLLGYLDDYINHPSCSEYIKNRWVYLEFQNIKYSCIYSMLTEHPIKSENGINIPPLSLHDDFSSMGYQKNDIHPNKLGHTIICNSILKKLKEDNFTKENFNK